MLTRIIAPLPDLAAKQAASGGVASLETLLGPAAHGVVWTTDAAEQVIDFLDEVPDEATDAEVVAQVEAKYGAATLISIRKNGKMKYAKKPKAGFVTKHEYAGLEVVE